MLEQPAFVELTKYKTVGINIPWTTKDYQQFLERLKEYINYPTNNKKIASYMGSHIEPNHVKYIKGIYLSNIKERI